MKVRVRVTKFSGQAKLRKVGAEYDEYEDKALAYEKQGFVKILKEDKTEIETKELKTKRSTKRK